MTAKKMLTVMPLTEVERLDVSKTIIGQKLDSGMAQPKAPMMNPTAAPVKRESVYGNAAKPQVSQTPVRVTKIGRNDPCPCGSGKKYKKCCGLNEGSEE